MRVAISEHELTEQLGLRPKQVSCAIEALRPTFLDIGIVGNQGAEAYLIRGITDAGRRAIGQWPSAETIVDRLAQGLLDAADQEPDEQRKSRLRSIAEGLRGFARDVAVARLPQQ
jgi:hypothetical protein